MLPDDPFVESGRVSQSLADARVFLVDGTGFTFRAYYALPSLTRRSDGLPIGAVVGFCNMLWKLLGEANSSSRTSPTHMAVIFDAPYKTFREDIYPEYKANRQPPPPDLLPQFGLIRQAVEAFSVSAVEQSGYEADDLIATYTRIASQKGADVTIVSSDKDMMQLIKPNVKMYDTIKNCNISVEEVINHFGVSPDMVVDVQALAGDSSDNIPGIPGIGIKTAAQLIREYGSLNNLLERAEEIKQPSRRNRLIEHAGAARLSRKLAQLESHVPILTPIEELQVTPFDLPLAVSFLKAIEFDAMIPRITRNKKIDVSGIKPASITTQHWQETGQEDIQSHKPSSESKEGWKPTDCASHRLETVTRIPFEPGSYKTITSSQDLDIWISRASEQGLMAIDIQGSSEDAMQADILGISIALKPGEACYIPLKPHVADPDMITSFSLVNVQDFLKKMGPVLTDPSILKIGHDLKYSISILSKYGLDTMALDDVMLMSYVLDAGRQDPDITSLSRSILNHEPISYREVTTLGKKRVPLSSISIKTATDYSSEKADMIFRLWLILRARLVSDSMVEVYERLERPLISVLAEMEKKGVLIDQTRLIHLSNTFAKRLLELEHSIYSIAGEQFNIASPKQLGSTLFEKLQLPHSKKTSTGTWATTAEVLSDMQREGHEIAGFLLEWRHLSKLKSTYADVLPCFINKKTGRIHTSYKLASTITGRLTSIKPNLQNIPARNHESRMIKNAFIAPSDFKLITADYSQIELRVLAYVADIPSLKTAFADELDIHSSTAAELFGVKITDVDANMRRLAKVINFGVLYGMSFFGLSKQIGISVSEAKEYIHNHFERFPGIREYIETTKESCRQNGYVTTIFGRKAHFPDINAKNGNLRAASERSAVNATIQGSASDIIRFAMSNMRETLIKSHLSAHMLLQVHDELIFEAPESEVSSTLPVIRQVMTEVCLPSARLSIPLKVNTRVHDCWN